MLVRPVLTVGGFGALTAVYLAGNLSNETYVVVVGMMIGFWFGDRWSRGRDGGK